MAKILLKRSKESNTTDLNFGEPAIRTLDTKRIELMIGDVEGRPQILNTPHIPTPHVIFANQQRSLPFDTPMAKSSYQHILNFRIKIPAFDKIFLEYSPFVELRMLRSVKNKKIVSPANYGGCILGFNNREQSSSQISQITQVLIPKEFKNSNTDVTFINFAFNPHLYFGTLEKSFSFPILKTEFENNSGIGRNRRQVSSSGFNTQIYYKRTASGIVKMPNKGKRLLVGFRIACLEPGTKNRLIYGEESNFFIIQPEVCKQKDATLDYYYKWNAINL